jgi:hypothetical protein
VIIHRNLWLKGGHPGISLPLFLFIEFLLWLRWVSFECWRCSWRAVMRRGKAVAELDGIGGAAQLGYLLYFGLCHCIPPAEVYAFSLYRSKSKQELWDYVFIHETQAFHRWSSVRSGEKPESLAMIQDKLYLTEFLEARGVPMAPVLGVVSRGETFDPEQYLGTTSRIFCKPRHGSASRDTFVIERRGEETAVFTVKRGVKTQHTSYDCLKKAMNMKDFLIQPFLDNHPDFAVLCPTEDVVTMRVITEIHPIRGMRCYCATLEIPNDTPDGVMRGHTILPIEHSSGQAMRFPRLLSPPAQARHDAVYDRIGNHVVPFWETIMKSAILAHKCFTDVRAIAWDYVVTPTGPVMLEGNTGWGATTPQMLCGGLLQNETVTG